MFVALLQTSMMERFAIMVERISLKPLAVSKKFMLDISLGPGCAFGYETVLKIQAEISPRQ